LLPSSTDEIPAFMKTKIFSLPEDIDGRTYPDTMLNGDIWRCLSAKRQIIVSFMIETSTKWPT